MATAEAAPEHAFLAVPPAPGRAYHPDGIELTYGQVRADVLRHRERYAAAGYGHGHRVALLLENRPEFFAHYLALNALGTSIVPINPDYRHDEMLYQMDHSDADLVVSIASRVADLEAVARERARPLPVIEHEAMPAVLPRPGAAPRAGRARARHGVQPALHLGHHRPTQGLRPHQPLLPQLWRLVSRPRRPRAARVGARPHLQPAAALSHQLSGHHGDGRDPHRQLPDPARALQPGALVA